VRTSASNLVSLHKSNNFVRSWSISIATCKTSLWLLRMNALATNTRADGCPLASPFFFESCLHTSSVDIDTYYTPGMGFSSSARIYASNIKSEPAATSSNGVPHPSHSSRAVDILLSTLDSYRGQVKKEQNFKKEEGESNGASQRDNSERPRSPDSFSRRQNGKCKKPYQDPSASVRMATRVMASHSGAQPTTERA
jgi:hypothetical protein